MDTLRTRAREILAQVELQAAQDGELQNSKKPRNSRNRTKESKQTGSSTFSVLFKLYEEANEGLDQWAIVYLLKNGGKLPDQPEDAQKFAKRRRKTEIRAERLLSTLQRTRLPKGRDLSWQNWLQALADSTSRVPKDENEAADWQARLLTEAAILPFPVNYETNEDLHWLLNDKGRLCVSFNGLSEHTFEIYCDRRQLHWFKRFLEDQQTKKANKDQHSTSLFTLRSGRIAWREGKGEGEPWEIHRLILSCAVETDTWTREGTEQIRQQKASECAKVIASTKAKDNLSKNQEAFIRRREKMLTLLDNPFPRPSRPLYQGQPSILASVSYGIDRPATLAIVDVQTGKAIISLFCHFKQRIFSIERDVSIANWRCLLLVKLNPPSALSMSTANSMRDYFQKCEALKPSSWCN